MLLIGEPLLALCLSKIERLQGFYKQRDNCFYPAWAYVFPTTLLRLPYSLIEALLWSSIVYYPVGLD
jgi:ABC-2 type transporter